MKSLNILLGLGVLLMTVILAFAAPGGFLLAAVFYSVASLMLARPSGEGRLCATLTSAEILMNVIQGFKAWFPALNRMGTDFQANSLKLNQDYTAHIAGVPTVYDVSSTYAVTGNNARDLLTDVPITVNRHKAVRLKWQHLNAIKDQKNKYDEVIANASYALAKAVVDDIVSGVTPDNATQFSIFAAADSDVDMLNDVTNDMNLVSANPNGRVMIVNTPVAGVLSADQRMIGLEYQGQIQGASGQRMWTNKHGYSLIQEFPSLTSANGTALTAVTGEADDDLLTKADHGLVTGQPVLVAFASGFTGLTTGTTYYAIRVSSSTFKVATSYANAVAGTAINITADGTDMTVTPTQSLTAFAFEARGVALLAGIPDDFNQDFLNQLGIPRVMGFEAVTDPETGLTMAAVSWQDAGTGDLNWAPTLVWGKRIGRHGASKLPGAECDYAVHRVVSA
jgi:hypothetical protein